ncbi:pentatricopeptide repeat-containing protein DOT4, chloroplastic-like [Amaranthus tricolor]|uniref:pentatricopeptide repeat-containing protein DOT4, chloroplastic-like n=1 Tax=Amaranthus tricolor TaxID=29722 RepID=UPI002584C5C5|nr:pentatricopeptide repeat-containing protein DOT4, chloroplastic-like [Amaranthus tricolor]XP_057548309.1 pentatricopeptide repeat-containing protein DOT4, chloroplastic-like [Amaranthus tricolor]XP_057548310.1 pentatricopeptide repeat-containing protein DOT4, chloroplastic-like [Amaranthus tricolor]
MEAVASPQSYSYLIAKSQKYLPLKDNSRCKFYSQKHPHVVSKSIDLPVSHHVLDKMPNSDTFAWNNLIRTHLAIGEIDNVMYIYQQMLLRGVFPDKHTIPRILAASHLSDSLFLGRQVHAHAVKLGISSEDYVISALMKMYGHLDGAKTVRQVFNTLSVGKSSVFGTLLISMYLKEHKPKLALDVFYQMVTLSAEIDAVAIMTAIGACGMLRSLQDGRRVHKIAKTCELGTHVLVCNSLLKMYLDCGSIESAREVFDDMSSRDPISWTEMIRGYVKNGGYNEGLKLFKKMMTEGIRPDPHAVSSILPACARMTSHKQGKEIHCYLIRNGVEMNITVENSLIDMYVKSGSIEAASRIFREMTSRDAISYTIMIYGYALHGQGANGVDLFREMKKNNFVIDEVAYSSSLYACVAANLVEEGMMFFSFIRRPNVKHYAFMVLLLARAGFFNKAKTFVEENQIGKHVEVVRALLDGCRVHRNTKTGKKIVEWLCEMEPLNADNYIMLSNWYAGNAKWDTVCKLRETIRDMGLMPRRAYSWIEFHNKIHVFGTGDVCHPRSEKLYWELQVLMKKMEEEGYVFDAEFHLHDVDEERECIPIGHSELLAISFGLISTEKSTIRITKNSRVCHNCHEIAKFISRLKSREIILKDPSCFHHFKGGQCSCGDFW